MVFLQYNYYTYLLSKLRWELSKHFLIEETKIMLNHNIPLKTDGCDSGNCIDVEKEYLLN